MSELMNDPVDFDIWARVEAGASSLVADWLSIQLSISKMDAYRAISPAVKSDQYVRIYTGYGWNDLPRLLGMLPTFVIEGTAAFAEQDCSPDYDVSYCELHKLYHHPTQCPICSGNYIHEGHRA